MAQVWGAKSPTEIVERTWEVPTGDEDSLASYVASASGVTVDADESNGDIITFTLSAGSVATTATVDITATTANGLVIVERFYLPIRTDANALSYSARNVCDYALRKVVGIGETATGAELDDAVENLSDMLAAWAGEGADLQAKLPVDADDTFFAPDWSIAGVKSCLRVKMHDFYGISLSRDDMMSAQRGLQRIKMRMLPDEREGAEFY